MLDSETKSRIDTARDILVGKIPNPQAQVEQITIAMIYKFMDDMDRQVEEAGGKRKFFSGTYSRYSWQNLMSPKLGGLEVLNLYSDAIQKMDLNPNIPLLFREIFKNAYLPYKDPETLRSFLKTINGFTYDHSERLGDAFEYLLSILGSQGDAGQFRTPRHIIDFMVYITDPQKGETILDPACGTAGFLISSYKHILKNNSSEYLKKIDRSFSFGSENGESCSGDKLTPDDRRKLPKNIRGYDISPDMVRLSLVNLYLHGFAEPNIFEYDTLTSEDKWNEYYNVILANPPFMSPKGGIRPHKRFSIESNRSEVLFVDYIAEHLTQFGRAAVIVPEGIIFQSGTAYKSLRKMLVENHLYSVVSLPAGVFNPYSGVKTSILLMDKTLSKRTENILFAKVENDGFDLGAQRRANTKGELPETAKAIKEYKESLLTGKNFPIENYPNLLLAPKTKISSSGDYNLSGERYREIISGIIDYEMVKLEDICDVRDGTHESPKYVNNGYPLITSKNLKNGYIDFTDVNLISRKDLDAINIRSKVEQGDILMPMIGTIGNPIIADTSREYAVKNVAIIKFKSESKVINVFIKAVLSSPQMQKHFQNSAKGATQKFLPLNFIRSLLIPLPPLEVQKEIVAEIEGYQKIIDGARQIVDNYKPRINIDPTWPMVELGEVCEINPETINPKSKFPKQTIYYVDISSVENETGQFLGYKEILVSEAPSRARRGIRPGDVLLSTVRPNLKAFTILKKVHERAIASTGFAILRAKIKHVLPEYIHFSVFSDQAVNQMISMMGKGAYPSINQSDVAVIKIPLPPLETQQEIVSRIEREQELVNANKELIKIFESKIKSKISSVWGEESE